MTASEVKRPKSGFRVRAVDVVDVLVYVVVLNLAAEYLPVVITETFTVSLLTALLLKIVLEVVVAIKNPMKARFKAGDLVVVIFHDHGTRYLGKMFNNDWMRKMGYLDKSGLTARDLVTAKKTVPMLSIETTDTVAQAVHVLSLIHI